MTSDEIPALRVIRFPLSPSSFLLPTFDFRLSTLVALAPFGFALAGLACGLGVGFLYSIPPRLGNWWFVDPDAAWIALGIFIGLVILAISNRMRAAKSGDE